MIQALKLQQNYVHLDNFLCSIKQDMSGESVDGMKSNNEVWGLVQDTSMEKGSAEREAPFLSFPKTQGYSQYFSSNLRQYLYKNYKWCYTLC